MVAFRNGKSVQLSQKEPVILLWVGCVLLSIQQRAAEEDGGLRNLLKWVYGRCCFWICKYLVRKSMEEPSVE